MICIRCGIKKVETLVRYNNIDFHVEPPEVKICKHCRVAIFPKHVPSKQYAKIAIMYSKKYGGEE